MLVLAVGTWPYGYYRLLRFVVCIAGAYVAYKGYAWKRSWALWTFGLVALLFNPVFPFHLGRQVWFFIDIAAAALFIVAVFALSAPAPKGETDV